MGRCPRCLGATAALRLATVQATFDEGYDSVVTIAAMDADSPWTGTVHRPGCLRGISTLTGFALAVEIGGWSRFTGNSIGAIRETPMGSHHDRRRLVPLA